MLIVHYLVTFSALSMYSLCNESKSGVYTSDEAYSETYNLLYNFYKVTKYDQSNIKFHGARSKTSA